MTWVCLLKILFFWLNFLVVDSALKSCSLPTIPGTLLFSKIALDQVAHPDVRRALVLRVLRYVSPYPWGSMNADAGRRKVSISRMTEQLWERVNENIEIRPFTAGGGVLWSPVIMRGESFRIWPPVDNVQLLEDETLGWIASRLPPLHRDKIKLLGIPNTLEIDATKTMVDAYQEWRNGGPSTISILYDSRFLLKFELDKMPQKIISCFIDNPANKNRLMLLPRTRWFLPEIIIERNCIPETLHNRVSKEPTTRGFLVPRMRHCKDGLTGGIDSGWINAQWVRPLTAL